MGKKKLTEYQGVSLPLPLIKKIKDYIADDVTYQTVPSFVRDSVREKINRLESKAEKDMNKLKNIIDHFVKNPDDWYHPLKKQLVLSNLLLSNKNRRKKNGN